MTPPISSGRIAELAEHDAGNGVTVQLSGGAMWIRLRGCGTGSPLPSVPSQVGSKSDPTASQ